MNGCVYKILVKVLVGRLGKVMDNIISENQSIFVSKSLIIQDGVVVLNELIKEAKKEKIGRGFLKITFVKANGWWNGDF